MKITLEVEIKDGKFMSVLHHPDLCPKHFLTAAIGLIYMHAKHSLQEIGTETGQDLVAIAEETLIQKSHFTD